MIAFGARQNDKSILPIEDNCSFRVYLSVGIEDCSVEVIAVGRSAMTQSHLRKLFVLVSRSWNNGQEVATTNEGETYP